MNRERAERSTILRGLVGSIVHGLNVNDGIEDRDEMGVCVERSRPRCRSAIRSRSSSSVRRIGCLLRSSARELHPLQPCCRVQTVVEGHESEALVGRVAQIEATGELDRIADAQGKPRLQGMAVVPFSRPPIPADARSSRGGFHQGSQVIELKVLPAAVHHHEQAAAEHRTE